MSLINPRNKGSGLEKLIRSFALLAIFALVGWAFWVNNERTIQRLNMTGTVWDETDTLTEKDKEFFFSFASGLEKQFGMDFRLQVRKRDLEVPSLDSKTLYIGLVPSRKTQVVVFPAIMERALGKEFTDYLDQAHFQQYWDDKGWVVGLKDASVRIWERLTALEAGQEPPPVPEVDVRIIETEPAAPLTGEEPVQPEEVFPASAPVPESVPEPVPEPAPDLAPEPAPKPEPKTSRGALNS